MALAFCSLFPQVIIFGAKRKSIGKTTGKGKGHGYLIRGLYSKFRADQFGG